MLKQKQGIPSNLPVKNKSLYARQFQQFQRRLEKHRSPFKFPTIPLKSRRVSLQENLKGEEEYMELVKRLMSNKEKFSFCEDKENLFEIAEKPNEELTSMKNKVVRLKNRFSHQSEPQTTDISDNVSQYYPPLSSSKGLRQPLNNRSRALSNLPSPLAEKCSNESSNFLLYKKGRRELYSRSKNE